VNRIFFTAFTGANLISDTIFMCLPTLHARILILDYNLSKCTDGQTSDAERLTNGSWNEGYAVTSEKYTLHICLITHGAVQSHHGFRLPMFRGK